MPQSRKWQITINNPQDKGWTHDKIKEELAQLSGCLYWCMADEIGTQGTYHTHIYFVCRSPVNHTTVNNRFPSEIAHRENVKGTSQQNRDYIAKDGDKYNKQPDGSYSYTDSSGKHHEGTNYAETFEEWGEMPHETQGKSKSAEIILAMIKDGAKDVEIIDAVPSAMRDVDKIARTRSLFRDAHFAENWRDLETTYIFGKTGVGKTRGIMDKYGYKNCYRVTDYKHPFDTYEGQDVIIFEEFRSQLKASDMLNYLDGYPLLLPCRYFNRQACYTKVYIVTNVPLKEQYNGKCDSATREAFERRIHKIIQYTQEGIMVEYDDLQEYKDSESMPRHWVNQR